MPPSHVASRLLVATLAVAVGRGAARAQALNIYQESARQREHDSYIHQQTESYYRAIAQPNGYGQTRIAQYRSPASNRTTVDAHVAWQNAYLARAREGEAADRQAAAAYAAAHADERYLADLRTKAAAGDVAAQVDLANVAYQGVFGAPVNKAEAYRLYRQAASGSPYAAGMAGSMAWVGDGIPRDSAAAVALIAQAEAGHDPGAIRWAAAAMPTPERVERAAAAGTFLPMLLYALALQEGKGVRADTARAFGYLQRSAEGGNARAMIFLGDAYAAGLGTARNRAAAIQWYTRSDAAGDSAAAYQLASLYLGDGAGPQTDLVAARRWGQRAVERAPDEWSYYLMGKVSTAEHRPDEARTWYVRAARTGENDALRLFAGMMLWRGDGGPVDDAGGRQLLEAAAAHGHGQSGYELATAYKRGLHGLPVDLAKAVALFRASAEQGFAASQFNLAVYYYRGEGVDKDNAQAARWCRLAADQRFAAAQHMLAVLYQYGEGVPQDAAQAKRLMALAAANGSPDALAELQKGYTGAP